MLRPKIRRSLVFASPINDMLRKLFANDGFLEVVVAQPAAINPEKIHILHPSKLCYKAMEKCGFVGKCSALSFICRASPMLESSIHRFSYCWPQNRPYDIGIVDRHTVIIPLGSSMSFMHIIK